MQKETTLKDYAIFLAWTVFCLYLGTKIGVQY